MYESFTDEALVATYHRQANVCLQVTQMPDEVRYAPSKKGGVSPNEGAATLNVFAIFHVERELVRRGLLAPAEAVFPENKASQPV